VRPFNGSNYSANVDPDSYHLSLAGDGFATECVLQGWLNEFAISGAASPITVGSGRAFVYGKEIVSSADETLAIPTPAGAVRIDCVVLEVDYVNKTADAAIVRVAGAEGGGAPAITQTIGTKYQVKLGEVSITVGGVTTCTPTTTRFLHFATKVSAAMMDTGVGMAAVDNSTIELNAGTLRVKDEGITAAKIANRTRALFVPVSGCWNHTDAAACVRSYTGGGGPGWILTDNKVCYGWGDFYTPADFVSGLTVKAVVYSTPAGGDIYCEHYGAHGAVDEAYATHAVTVAAGAIAVGAAVLAEIASLALSALAAGDYVSLRFARDGTNGADSLNADAYFKGWIVSYTADS
jgi:hypothetical protein